jgi:hypothetical protein
VRSLAAYPSLPGAASGCGDACKAESSSALALLMFVLANRNSTLDWSAIQRASILGKAEHPVRSLTVFQTAVDQRARPACIVTRYAAHKRDIRKTASELV